MSLAVSVLRAMFVPLLTRIAATQRYWTRTRTMRGSGD